jgi:hypothetical protein
MKNLHTKALAWLLVLASFSSCSLAFDDIATKGSITPEIALPLLESQYRLGDLMKGLGANDYLRIRPDGQYEMVFNGKYSETQMIPNVLSFLPPVQTFELSRVRSLFIPFPNPVGMKIDSMVMKTGVFQWRIVNPFPEDIMVTITFNSMTQNGQPFTRSFMIPKDDARSLGEGLEGYTLKSDASGNMEIVYKAEMGGVDVPLDNQSVYQFTGTFEAKKIVGYFGRTPISLKTQNIALDFFKNWSQIGEISFTEPTLNVTVENGFGFPVMAKSQIAEGVKKDGTKLPITGVLKDGFNIGYPSFLEMGRIKQTVISLNKGNSNIVDVFNASPVSASLTLDVLTHPDPTNLNSGFLLDDSGVRFKMDASFPLKASAKNFTYTDTKAVNFKNFTEVTDVEFKIVTDNTLPVDIGMQIYFLDSTNTKVDSLKAIVAKAAPVSSGFVVGSTSNTTLIPVGIAQFNNIKTATKMIVTSQLTTTGNGTESVNLKADQKLFLNIGLKAKTDYKVKIKI